MIRVPAGLRQSSETAIGHPNQKTKWHLTGQWIARKSNEILVVAAIRFYPKNGTPHGGASERDRTVDFAVHFERSLAKCREGKGAQNLKASPVCVGLKEQI